MYLPSKHQLAIGFTEPFLHLVDQRHHYRATNRFGFVMSSKVSKLSTKTHNTRYMMKEVKVTNFCQGCNNGERNGEERLLIVFLALCKGSLSLSKGGWDEISSLEVYIIRSHSLVTSSMHRCVSWIMCKGLKNRSRRNRTFYLHVSRDSLSQTTPILIYHVSLAGW